MRRTLLVGAATATLAGALLAAPSPASALPAPAAASGWDEWMNTEDADPGGRVQFARDGDVMRLCDLEADGWAVYLFVKDDTQQLSKYDYTIGGAGRCVELRASLGAPYDLREGNNFYVYLALTKNGTHRYIDHAVWKN